MALRLTLTALCAVLTVYAGFCLTWGIGYNTDSFQEKSGIHARPSTAETLAEVTAYFAGNLAACADDVPRDESGVCTLDRQAVLNRSASALDVLCGEVPLPAGGNGRCQGLRLLPGAECPALHRVLLPFTGEPNVNMDSPAAFLPATVCHELAHQRGITAEEACNFIGILAAVRSEDTGYRYSGWLTGFGYLSNALYSADREAWQTIRDALPDTVVADLRADNAYWAQFRGVVSKVSDTVYDSFLKSNGDTDGSKSYGVVTDLLVAYFRIKNLPSGEIFYITVYRPRPGMFSPPVSELMELFMASSACRSASFTAEMTRSCNISASSGSMTSGLMVSLVSSFLPVTTAVTAPPPTEAVNSVFSTSSCAFAISCCIFSSFCCICACCCIIPAPPVKSPAGAVSLCHIRFSFISICSFCQCKLSDILCAASVHPCNTDALFV